MTYVSVLVTADDIQKELGRENVFDVSSFLEDESTEEEL